MRHLRLAALAALALPAAALAQDEAAPDRSQDMAWHMAQQQALASRTMAEGWSWLPGGVLWRRTKGNGGGAHPTVDDTVTVHYVGTFVDGETFDSSRQRGQPATFPLGGLIKAWQEAIPMAGVGDTIELAIPAAMAYGPVGRGPIPGDATLLFEIELLGIE
ncbi:FKBP-type peptidyl-prolyl cis-trans isomerase [Altererythrobacter salegens]|uniref:Peptidyl-prolyl cis-trans isomerase n=1 Tax=Croceibacterium salegens TaxID=1737568 RepID=A0A6I4SX24_9SPHN|nr:FKBP-type peptidyl-prolyl cis-trans isomerase [Croceibacterium salegens]MXO59899.1 FKBP-type peptidyl-prolyl cis-trans isomerase [Croceibacterium salegens]